MKKIVALSLIAAASLTLPRRAEQPVRKDDAPVRKARRNASPAERFGRPKIADA